MKRLMFALAAPVAAFCIALTFGAATVGAGASALQYGSQVWTLTLAVNPTTFTVGGTADASGTLKNPGGQGVGNQTVTAYVFDGYGCSGDPADIGSVTTKSDGNYDGTLSGFDAGQYSMVTETTVGEGNIVQSGCVNLTVTDETTPPQPAPAATTQSTQTTNSIFLCYSKWQVDPGVWSYDTAKSLMDGGGYWLPYAVPGNVDYGTNIGGYHLVCNIASTQSANGSILGASEDVFSPDVANAAGVADVFGPFYPVVGG